MLVLSHLLNGAAMVLSGFLFIYQIILIARAVTSWVSASPRNPIVAFLYMVTEPPLKAIRRRLPSNLRYFPLDIAFLVLFALVIFAQYGIVQSMLDLAASLRQQQMQMTPGDVF